MKAVWFGALCILFASLVHAQPHPQPTDGDSTEGKLMVATCQFPVSGDIAANAEWVRRQMREAAEQEADVVHFPECALSGYAGKDHETPEDLAYWRRQNEEARTKHPRLRALDRTNSAAK